MHLTNEVAISGTDQVIAWHRNSSPDAGYIVAFLLKNLGVSDIVRGVFWFNSKAFRSSVPLCWLQYFKRPVLCL